MNEPLQLAQKIATPSKAKLTPFEGFVLGLCTALLVVGAYVALRPKQERKLKIVVADEKDPGRGVNY